MNRGQSSGLPPHLSSIVINTNTGPGVVQKAAVGLGVGVVILKLVIYMFQAAQDQEDTERNEWSLQSAGYSWSWLVRKWIRRFILGNNSRRLSGEDCGDDDDYDYDVRPKGAIMTHRGSCHCSSIEFEILAPYCLLAWEGVGRIRYRHTEINASKLRVTRGKALLQTYYVETRAGRGAHAFCSRCGVHLLYAPSQETPTLMVNVDCLEEGIHKVKMINAKSGGTKGMPKGSPLDGQWEGQSPVSALPVSSFPLPPSSTFRDNRSVSSENSGSFGTQQRPRWGAPEGSQSVASESTTSRNLFFDTPATPTKADFDDAAPLPMKSYSDSLRMPDSSATTETESTGTASTLSQSLPPLHASQSSSFDYQQQQASTSSPQFREQMRYYMKKHLSSTPSADVDGTIKS